MSHTVVVGRAADADFSLAFDTVSRYHCQFVFEDEDIWIEDLNSTHGTYLNERRLPPGERTRLQPGESVTLADEVVLDRDLIVSLRPDSVSLNKDQVSTEHVGTDSSADSLSGESSGPEEPSPRPGTPASFQKESKEADGGFEGIDLRPLFREWLESPRPQLLSAVLGGVLLLVIALLSWGGWEYYTFRARAGHVQSTIEVIEQAEASRLSDGSQTGYQELEAYHETVQPALQDLENDISALEGARVAGLLFGDWHEEVRQEASTLRREYGAQLDAVERVLEHASDDYQEADALKASSQSLVDRVKQEIGPQDDTDALQAWRNQVREKKSEIAQVSNRIETEKRATVFSGLSESLRKEMYQEMDRDLEESRNRLTAVDRSLAAAIQYQNDHMQDLRIQGAQLVDRSDGISAVYETLQPLTQDLSRELRPLRESIQVMEQPVVNNPLGEDVTALSILTDIDPMTGQVITSMRDLIDLVTNIENELNELKNRVGSLRETARRFRSTPTRSNAIEFRSRADAARAYVRERRDLLDPVQQRVNNVRGRIDTISQLRSRVSVQAAQDILRRFLEASYSVIELVERPIRVWEGEIDSAIQQLNAIGVWEDRYREILSSLSEGSRTAARDFDEPQDASPPPPDPNGGEESSEVFVAVEESPELIGGMDALYDKVGYPDFARRAGIEGRVVVQFVVDEEGNVTDPQVSSSPHDSLSEEAVRALSQMQFTPGRQRGNAVRVQMALPVMFGLN